MLSELFNILTAISPTISVSFGIISTVANIMHIQCLPPFFNEIFYHFKYSYLISPTVKYVLYLIFQTLLIFCCHNNCIDTCFVNI